MQYYPACKVLRWPVFIYLKFAALTIQLLQNLVIMINLHRTYGGKLHFVFSARSLFGFAVLSVVYSFAITSFGNLDLASLLARFTCFLSSNSTSLLPLPLRNIRMCDSCVVAFSPISQSSVSIELLFLILHNI